VVWRWREDLNLLVLLVHMIGLVMDCFVVKLLVVVLLGMVGMCNNLLVVGWLISSHFVFGGLSFGAIPGGMCAVFVVKEIVEPSRLRSLASVSGVGVTALCGYSWRRAVSLVGCWLVMVFTCCWLQFGLPDLDCAGLTHFLLDCGVSLGFH
jgi:hypothetical protein